MARRGPTRQPEGRPGRVVATKGRRVVVRDADGDRTCFLSGQRAVIGDAVLWVGAQGEGGKLVHVLPRERALIRKDFKGREQVVAAHLGGLLVVASTEQPAYRPGLLDRYHVAARCAGIELAIVLTKIDLGVSDEVEADLAWRASVGVPHVRVSNTTGQGVDHVRDFLAEQEAPGPWACVGHSGVGKTSLVAALLPEIDVGPVAEISQHWDQGRHTTTGSHIYTLCEGVEIADSPGIRTFLSSGLEPETVRDFFPGMGPLGCRYRDCLHRIGEEGCVAEAEVEPQVLERYRRMFEEVTDIDARVRSGSGWNP